MKIEEEKNERRRDEEVKASGRRETNDGGDSIRG